MNHNRSQPCGGQPPPQPEARPGRSRAWHLAAAAALALLAGLLAWQAAVNLRGAADGAAYSVVPAVGVPVEPPDQVWSRRVRERAELGLDRADAAGQAAVAAAAEPVDAIFAAAAAGAPRFAARALGWEGRWPLLRDGVGLGDGDYATFVREVFARELLAPGELEESLHRAVAGYLEAVGAAEAELVLDLGADLAGFAGGSTLPALDPGVIGAALADALSSTSVRAADGARDEAARELVALLVSEVLAQAAVRLGASAGLLGAGAAASMTTFGAALLVALVVDELLGRLWDGQAELAAAVVEQLEVLRAAVVAGTADAPGLRPRLEALESERAARRRAAVLRALGVPEEDP